MRSLVTGGAGFIGCHVVRRCLALGQEVVVLDDLSGGFRENVPHGAIFVQGSITDRGLVARLFQQYSFDYVYHLAAYAAEGLSPFIRHFNYTNNLIGSVNLINSAVLHNIKCFIFTSSIAVYGAGQLPMTEELTPLPEDPYGIAKRAVELDLENAHRMFGLDYIIFRPHNVYGEYQNIGDRYRNVIGIFMNQVMQGKPMTIFGDGTQTRAFSHIDDVAPHIANSVNVPAAMNTMFNVGADTPYTVLTLAEEVAAAFGVTPRVEFLPPRNEVLHAYSDHCKARAVFGAGTPIRLTDGIHRMAAWAKQHGPRETAPFAAIEVSKNLPPSWAAWLNTPPAVSICLTTYNRASVLPRTIDSILAQTFKDFELIISDDCSPDNTEQICREYEKKDKRVRYFRNERNLRMPGNLNAAISRARGACIANLHDGDVYRPDLIEKWKNALDANPDAPFVFNAWTHVALDGSETLVKMPFGSSVPGDRIAEYFFQTTGSCVWGTVIARASAYEKAGSFDAHYGFISDVDMWLRLAYKSDVAYIAEPLMTVTARENDHPYRRVSWDHVFWQYGIYAKYLPLYRGRVTEPGPRWYRAKLRRLFLRGMLSATRRRKWQMLRQGLAILRDSNDWVLRCVGRLFGSEVCRPAWYRPDAWKEIEYPESQHELEGQYRAGILKGLPPIP